MKTLKLGLISSPGLPADLTSKVVVDLPDLLNNQVDQHVSWKPEIIIDPLIGSAEFMNQLRKKVTDLKNKNNWDYVICLTDLPHFMEKHIIMTEINRDRKVTLISVPSFGFFPVKRRIKQTINQVMREMYIDTSSDADVETKTMTRQAFHQRKGQDEERPFWSVQRVAISGDSQAGNEQDDTNAETVHKQDAHENENKNEETQENTEQRADVRYIIKSKLLGQFRILAGMVFANRPWTALSSFKKVLMLAFGTGIYITIFPTPWELSTIYSIPRFLVLATSAIVGMVIWMIFAHNLWEKPTKQGDIRLRKLNNITTASTLGLIAIINYIVLFCLFLAILYLFVPSELFEASTSIGKNPTFKHYVQLTWLATSLGTLAGSIGTTVEDEETIRNITYSYRQIYRYYEIQDKEDNENLIFDKESYKT